MEPIIIENSKIPKMLSIFININAITLYPFIISRGEMSETTIRHEKIHIVQQAELLLIGFYLLYAFYWTYYRVIEGYSSHSAYMAIPFEREAYAKQEDENYLNNRERFAWRIY